MSLSGSSASRKSICAMTRLASSSSMNVGRKMIRSLSRREKMSKARSPRGVCSMTIGTRAILRLLLIRSPRTVGPPPHDVLRLALPLRVHGCVLDQEVERLAFAEPEAQRLEVTTLLHHTPHGRRRSLARARDRFDLGVHLGIGRRQLLAIRDRLQEQRALHRSLRAGAELGHELRHVPL